MKKGLLLLLAVLTITFCFTTIAIGDEVDRPVIEIDATIVSLCSDRLVTTEEPMPLISMEEKAFAGQSIKKITARKKWAASTAKYLSEQYGQRVLEIEEDAQVIRFIFAIDEYDVPDIEVDAKNPYMHTQVFVTEYDKPETKLIFAETLDTQSGVENRAPAISTKRQFLGDWMNGYKNFTKKSVNNYTAGLSVMLLLFPEASITKSVAEIALGVWDIVYSWADKARPITDQLGYKAYYYNHVGYTYYNGLWAPWVQVGSIRYFKRNDIMWNDSAGQPHWNLDVKNGSPSSLPTNYDAIKKKTYFDNSTWITNKAIEMHNNGGPGYVDIFGIALTVR